MHAAGDLVGRVALDRLDAPVGQDALDDADVLVPDDEIAGARDDARPVGDRPAGALRPRVERVDGSEALALLAERHAGLARGPGGEVRAPRADAAAGRRLAVLRDPRRVVGPRRLLGHADLALDGG